MNRRNKMATRAPSGAVTMYFLKDSNGICMLAKHDICYPAVPPAVTVRSVAGGLQMHGHTISCAGQMEDESIYYSLMKACV